jgi:hypothetical protein
MLLDSVDLEAVPEPVTYALMGGALLGALFTRRLQKRRSLRA